MNTENISIAKATVAGGALLLYSATRILPAGPQWMRKFAQEEPWHQTRQNRKWLFSTLCLLALGFMGSGLAICSVRQAVSSLWRWLDLSSWAIALLLTVVQCPQTTPQALFTVFGGILVADLVLLGSNTIESGHVDLGLTVDFSLATLAVLIIITMPMRNSDSDTTGIAGPRDPATRELRTPEDNLSLLQFMTVSWMEPLIKKGLDQQLNDEDVWLLPHDFQHARLHMLFKDLKGSLFGRLLRANGLDLIITTTLGLLELAANLSAPLLLQGLLSAFSKRESDLGDNTEAITFAVAILFVRLMACQASVFSLWYCRRAYERSRGELITAVYAKTLTRKCQGSQPSEHDPEVIRNNELDGGEIEVSRFSRLLQRLGIKSNRYQKIPARQAPATTGKILNLLRSDCYELSQRFWEWPSIVTKPLTLVLSIVLVWRLLGWTTLAGVLWIVLLQLMNGVLARNILARERQRRVATDVRLNATSEFIEGIRHLRWYDWQTSWIKKIMEAREHELHTRLITSLWTAAIATINNAGGSLFPVISFVAFTYIAGRPLPIEVAFPAIQLFGMLETSLKEAPELIQTLLNASVAYKRLEAFMEEPDKEEGPAISDPVLEIKFQDASFAWPGVHHNVLRNLNLELSAGLTVVYGKVGAGKSAFMQAILGELDRTSGDCILPQETIGYCAQSPWLQNMTIRENILFCAPYDPTRYKRVLDACALTPDLANFRNGDLTSIGENGVGLSGGQKARLALARAVYSQSRILLLDDPLAPLDHNTATLIVQKLFQGPLVQKRTIVLATHRIDLVTHLADQIVEIDRGKARLLDGGEACDPESCATTIAVSREDLLTDDALNATEEEEEAAVPNNFIEEEHRKSGSVVLSVYWTYIKAGKLKWWGLSILMLGLMRLAKIFGTWWMKSWGEGYQDAQTQIILQTGPSNTIHTYNHSSISTTYGFLDRLPNPRDDVRPWAWGYLLIALSVTTLFVLSSGAMLVILLQAARTLFDKVLQKVSNATFRFYDVTPVGRLMNRLTSDFGMLDGGVLGPLQNVALWSLTWISCMVVIASTTPLFLVVAVFMTIGFVMIFNKFMPASQSLRRLEMASLSPLMSNFGILLDGLATIRAFKAQPHFQSRNIVVTDTFQKMDHFYWSLQAWLMYRFDLLGAISTFILTVAAIYGDLRSGLAAFVLTTASQFVEATHNLCKAYGQLQMDFVAVERVIELLDLEEEPSGDQIPPVNWPAHGDDVVFDSVTLRYAPHLPPSLSDATFRIPSGSTCCVMGRTGSGKSTLAYAMLATLRPEVGHIHIGDLDLSKVNVRIWRQRISFVAQDPVLFPGTLRQNLDPVEGFSTEQCRAVIHRVLGPEWSLKSHVAGGGKNLSQGQRQLVGIGRAVLRRSPIVILDEATASIDKETALAIQEVLREELKDSTVITIAHRLEAVKDADYMLRLDGGRIVECGPI